MGGKTSLVDFKAFYSRLLQGAPEGYTPRLILLEKQGKDPASGWGPVNTGSLTKEEAEAKLKQGYNIGIVAREDDPLVIVDRDSPEVPRSKPTLTVRSRKRVGFHDFYFQGAGEKIPNIPAEDEGEVRVNNQYVVAPGSFVPCSQKKLDAMPEEQRPQAGKYTVEDSLDPAEITLEELPGVFLDRYYIARAQKEARGVDSKDFDPWPGMSDLYKLTWQEVLPGTPQGQRVPHPLHGSDTGKNFIIEGNLAHCWRHSVSLTVPQFLAVKYGLLGCVEAGNSHANGGAGPSQLTGDKELAQKVFKKAKEEGLLKEDAKPPGKKGPGKQEKKLGKADKLINLGQDHADLLRDEHGTAFVALKKGDSKAVFPLRGRDFKNCLHKLLWDEWGEASNSEATTTALNTLEAMALDKPQYTLHNRVAWGNDGELYYDPARNDWQIIKISAEGWEWVPHNTPIFRRYKHMDPQVNPDSGAGPEEAKELLKHLRVGNGEGVLYMALVASFFIPDIPHPIPIVAGPSGVAKSTTQEMTRKVIDPSSMKTLTLPKNKEELVQALQHNYIAMFDNVTRLSREQSDTLCRAVTGTGVSKRELYTDDDDFIYSFIRCVGTNGLNVSATFPDFLDRAIIFYLEKIPVTQKVEKRTVWEKFAGSLPKIVGGLLTAVAKALSLVEGVREELKGKLPRMADFAVWGEALARAMGYEPMEFHEAYNEKIRQQNREVITGDIIGEIILSWIDKQPKNTWEGSPSALLKELTEEAKEAGLSEKQKGFPQAPNSLSRKLNELKTNLEEEGVVIEKAREGKKRKRQLKIYKEDPHLPNYTPQKPSVPSDRPQPGPKEADDKADDISGGKNTVRRPSATKPGPRRPVDDADDICGYPSSKGGITQDIRLKKIVEVIGGLERRYGTAKLEEIKACLGEALKANLEQDLEKLKKEGVIFEPKPGEYKVVKG